MLEIPSDIDIKSLPGPDRGNPPAIYYRDEIIWSSQNLFFALAYTIIEASYGNSVGNILWGTYDGKKSKILGNPENIGASCWKQPWCKWLDEKSFVFKAHKYHDNSTYIPLVIIHMDKGFAVIPNSNNLETWIDEITQYGGVYKNYEEKSLLEAVINEG